VANLGGGESDVYVEGKTFIIFSMTSVELEQRFVIKYLRRKGMKLYAIHQELCSTYGEAVYSIETVKYWLHQIKLEREDLTDQPTSGRPPLDDLDASIMRELLREPFSSVRSLEDATGIPAATVYRRLTQSLQMVSRHLRWVPHMLTEELRAKRCTQAKELRKVLKAQQKIGWRDIITGDESWIHYDINPSSIWTVPGDEVPVRPRITVQSEKRMLIVFWGISGIVHRCWLPKGERLNAEFVLNNVLQPISDLLQSDAADQKPFTLLHMDNARPHTAVLIFERLRSLRLRRAPQPPYSPDLAPSDFFLFGWLKGKLAKRKYRTEDELFEAVDEILGTLTVEKIQEVFQNWIERLDQVIATNGDYVS